MVDLQTHGESEIERKKEKLKLVKMTANVEVLLTVISMEMHRGSAGFVCFGGRVRLLLATHLTEGEIEDCHKKVPLRFPMF